MKQIILRIDDATLQKFDNLPTVRETSRTAAIQDLIARAVDDYDPGIILGYVKLVNSELDEDSDCPECHSPFTTGVWLGYTADLRAFGPVCGLCANSD